ncbi:MAG: HAD-IC family P-type ATPase [Bacteroidetes bacterium]|nr:HAD-IC family P-type ATPase [Bacteroidota bacterium]
MQASPARQVVTPDATNNQMELKGLTYEEVKERRKQGLTNAYASHKTKTLREIIIENLFSLFNIITLGIIVLVLFFYMKFGDVRLLLDSIGIFTIVVINTSIALYQEIKAKRALDKVNLLFKREVVVIRGGEKKSIDRKDIVKDDIIELKRGDQVVVDGTVASSRHLEVDESLLTGESVPVEKAVGTVLLSGSFCVSGLGYYKAEKLGAESHANSVTNLAKKYKFTLTPLQKRINTILKVLFGVALILTAIEIISYNTASHPVYTFTDHIRKIATILISLVPQGLVLTASITFAIGVYRISKTGAIVQKLNAIESFSNVEYVCMDKTGTLTENKLKTRSVINVSGKYFNDEVNRLLGAFVYHSTEKNATIEALEHLSNKEGEYVNEMPFSSASKMSLLELNIGGEVMIFVFGAYDMLAQKTGTKISELNAIFGENKLGIYRNLLFGRVTNFESLENITEEILPKMEIMPLAIVSITDTVRKDVFDAITLFQNNGIKFKILTGDSPEAVKAVLNEIGWNVHIDSMVTGNMLDAMNGEEFRDAVFGKTVFARLKPEHKLKIIKTFRKEKKHTAMIGDGVNDLPAIKSADIGIAMEEGSAITKEVADIVLLKNKFSLLPKIFDEGNKIVNSVSAIAKLFLTKNFLVIFLTLISLLPFIDFPLTPRRVSLLNVFSIGLPAFIITLKNNNVSKCRNFVVDVFSFVITSSFIITLATVSSQYVLYKYSGLPAPELNMSLMTILVILAVVNFFIVASESGETKRIYYYYGIFLIALFVLLAGFNIDFSVLNILRTFYELIHLNFINWIYILVITATFAMMLAAAHKIRERYINN